MPNFFEVLISSCEILFKASSHKSYYDSYIAKKILHSVGFTRVQNVIHYVQQETHMTHENTHEDENKW